MAKWGEGDPRWIVEERPDSTNVNNWHWTERDATQWSKDLLKSLFLKVKCTKNDSHWEIVDITKLEGEASASNRKGKLIFFYDWEVKVEWKGKTQDDVEDQNGYLEIYNMSEENEPDELEVRVSLKESSCDAAKLKEFVRQTSPVYAKEIYGAYIQKLKEEFSQGMILPTKGDKRAAKTESENSKVMKTLEGKKPSRKENKSGVKVANMELKLEEEFKTSADELYSVLTDEGRISMFTRACAEVYAQPGGTFSILNGNITGEFVELVPNEKIVQKWKFKDWPSGLYSKVTMELEQKSDSTLLKLTQTGVPDYDFERTEEGWKRHFWENIKMAFGFGAKLF